MMKYIRSYRLFITFIVWISLVACSDEISESYQLCHSDKGSCIMPIVKVFTPITVTTRGDSKTDPEKRVTSLHLFIFDSDGEYLACTQGSQYYQYNTGGAFSLIRDLFTDQNKAAQATVCLIANLPQYAFAGNGTDYGQIRNLDDLHHYLITAESLRIPDAGLVMYGEQTLNLRKSENQNETFQVELRSLFARIDFRIDMNPNFSLGSYPSFTLTSYDICNVPRTSLLEETDEETADDVSLFDVNNLQISGSTTLVKGQSISFSFYMCEHRLDPARTQPLNGYPENIPENSKQRFKPDLAKDKATYVVLHGLYTDVHEKTQLVSLKIYLGANATNDFNIMRNCQYKNVIALTGFTNHDGQPEGSVSFDHRVNIQNERFILSVERETELDSHIEVRPMDIYIGNSGNRVEIEIMDPYGANSWVRLEKTDEEQSYFYTDLLTSPSRLLNSTSTSLERDSRIWFYFDEYTDLSKASPTQCREAIVKMRYFNKGESEPCEIVNFRFRQHALFPVEYDGHTYYMEYFEEYLHNFDPKNQYGKTDQDGLPWGLSGTTISSDNLSIVLNTSNSWFSDYKQDVIAKVSPYYDFDNEDDGMNYTKKIIAKSGSFVRLLKDQPTSAVEHCYNKNKRNADGTVDENNMKWYMPAIGEMEDICMGAYSSFSMFQDNFYWASQPAYENWTFDFHYWLSLRHQMGSFRKDNVDYARATRVTYNGQSYSSVSSGVEDVYKNKEITWYLSKDPDIKDSAPNSVDPDPGYLPRTEKHRVRAVYWAN